MISSLINDSRIFILLIIISLILFFSDTRGFLTLPKGVFQAVTSPVQFGLYKTSQGVVKQFEFVVLTRKAAQENKALTEQLASVLSENAQLRKKLAETEGFLQQQQTLGVQTFNLVAARPIGSSRYLLIDKGSDDGLKVNQAVIYKDSFIGTIKEVSPKKSQIILSSDPDSAVAAFVQSQSGKAKGVLNGEFGSEMLLDKILHQEPVSKDDLVYSEGTETNIPRGLILGQVSEVLQRDNEVFKQAKVKPVFNVADLDIVFVVTN